MRILRGVQFDGEGVVIEFLDTEDQRENGLLLHKALYVPNSYGEVDDLHDAVNVALKVGLAEMDVVPQLEVDEPEDDIRPFDNPLDYDQPADYAWTNPVQS